MAVFADHGIRVHIDDGTLGYDLGGGQGFTPADHDLLVWQEIQNRRNSASSFDPERGGTFHYAVYAHRLTEDMVYSPPGIAETPGDTFAVGVIGAYPGQDEVERGTQVFMQELGHNILARYCNDVVTAEQSRRSCFPGVNDPEFGTFWNQALSHFDIWDREDGVVIDQDEDGVPDRASHFSGDVMCSEIDCTGLPTEYWKNYSPATWAAVDLWRSFL